MKPGFNFLLALLFFQAPAAPVSHLRYMRAIVGKGAGESCATLDADVMAHAAPSLKDLRLLATGEEIPYVITLSETADLTDETAAPVDVRSDRGSTVLDLQMPPRPYTDVELDLRQRNFVVSATVSGADELNSTNRIPLGSFTLFDLTARHLSRNTVLALQESAFRYLHVELRGNHIAPGSVLGAKVPPSRQAQTLYTPVIQTAGLSRDGNETVATLRVPAHVPLERVSIELAPRFTGSFDRKVRVTGQADGPDGPVETLDGKIVQTTLGKIRQQQLAFDAAMGVNLQKSATVRIAIQNGKEAPLPISLVRFEMRRRSICFSAPSTALVLFYGDPALSAPRYVPSPPASERNSLPATLGPETLNPGFVERTQLSSGRRPGLVWLLLLAGFGVAGTIALHILRSHSLHDR